VKIQPQWVVTPGKQTTTTSQMQSSLSNVLLHYTPSVIIYVNKMGPAGLWVRSQTPIERILSSFCMRTLLLSDSFISMRNKTFGMLKYQPSPPIIGSCQEAVCPLYQPSPPR